MSTVNPMLVYELWLGKKLIATVLGHKGMSELAIKEKAKEQKYLLGEAVESPYVDASGVYWRPNSRGPKQAIREQFSPSKREWDWNLANRE